MLRVGRYPVWARGTDLACGGKHQRRPRPESQLCGCGADGYRVAVMTRREPIDDVIAPRPSLPARIWAAGFGLHLALLLVLLVGVGVATSTGDSFVTDDGSYELQLRALEQGSWVWISGTEQYDPAQQHYPVAFADSTSNGFVPLAKHPAWPWLAHAVSPITGIDRAYAALGLLAVVLAASAAWALAGEHDPTWRRLAFWLTGCAPVVVTFAVGWAHAAAAAAAGVAVLGTVRVVARGARAAPVAFVAVGVVAGVLFRTEGILVAVALAGAGAVGGYRAGRSWRWSLGWAAAVVGVMAATVRLEARWVRSITGGETSPFVARTNGGRAGAGFLENRFLGAVRSLIEATDAVPRPLLALALVGAAVASGLVASGRSRWTQAWLVSSVLLVVVLALRVVAEPNLAVTGMLVAWPALVVGVGAGLTMSWRRLPVETTMAALFGGAIIASQYPDGGAGQWGGRFFAPATVALVMIITLGIRRLLDAAGETASPERRRVRAVVAALVVAPLLLGVLSVNSARSASQVLFDQVEAEVDGVAITPIYQLPRMMWRRDLPWLVVEEGDGGDDLAGLLASLGNSTGPGEISLVLRSIDRADADAALARSEVWTVADRRMAGALFVVVLQRPS